MSESGSCGSSQQKQIPLLPLSKCPRCGGQVVHFVSHRPHSRGRRFYKCEHQSNEAGGCSFWEWEECYRFLEQLGGGKPSIRQELAEIDDDVLRCSRCF
ncbi:hypothetical protein E2562_028046 [Oryza meyeriana var. granulata]|uniref:GRF-type domain-containing protein n=1 Tax=Oryza meyeriana var. granulata TaxID=110450 RepID=A0A6G1C214_9ORYZ|nr:hypothetical protein E2562_028046 [Oryza meyeriana var. granulata]